jgi:hypothetical protein
MRKLVWAALAAFLLATAFFSLISYTAKEQGQPTGAARGRASSFGLYGAEMADWGNSTAALLHLFLYPSSSGKVIVSCSPLPLQSDFLLLSSASVPGVGAGLAGEVRQSFSECGISAREKDAAGALGAKNAMIVSSAGALPSELYDRWGELAAKNSRAVAIVALPGKKISSSGEISEAAGSSGFEIAMLELGSEKAAANEAVRKALAAEGSAREEASWEGERTIAVGMNSSSAYCRAVYLDNGGDCRVAETGLLQKPPGMLRGPASAMTGKPAQFELSLSGQGEAGRKLEFEARVLSGRKEARHFPVAGGEIGGGWASLFMVNFSFEGPALVKVEDQFGRLHAQAYAESLGLEVAPVSQQGNRHEFEASFGGKPLDGMVSVWLEGGGKRQFYSAGGRLVVFASPEDAKGSISFEYQGVVKKLEYATGGSGLLDAYRRYGLPAAALLLAVYLVIRARRKVKYAIVFPEGAQSPPCMMDATWQEIRSAYDEADRRIGGHCLAVYPEEMAERLAEKKDAEIEGHSLRRVLAQLVQQGRFCESEGAYAPCGLKGGFSCAQLHAMRLLHEVMLEKGLRFSKKRLLALPGKGLEIAVFGGKKDALCGMGKLRRAVLFESAQQKREFEHSLSEPCAQNSKIKLALDNNKLVLLAPLRSELEALLS